MGNNSIDCFKPHKLQANPDISGIGVLMGFLVSAWTGFFVMIFHYMATPQESNNVLDISIHKTIQRVLRKTQLSHWASVSESVVLAMSDQLLVTGLAFIISGYYQFQSGLSCYHWQIITKLVWFSSVTHIASLMCLEQYFRKHKWIWYTRVFLMTGLALMLAVGIIPTGYGSSGGGGAPIICLFKYYLYQFNIDMGLAMVVSEIMLLGALVIRLVQMFSATRKLSSFCLSTLGRIWRAALVWCCGKLQRSHRCVQAIFLPAVALALGLSLSIQCLSDTVRSRIFGLLWLLLSLIWGCVRLFTYRKWGTDEIVLMPVNGVQEPKLALDSILEENTWSFGQLVPVLLLLVPALQMAEGCSEVACRTRAQLGQSFPARVCQASDESRGRPDQNVTVRPRATRLHDLLQTAQAPPLICFSTLFRMRFQNEPWYLNNIYLAVALIIAVACLLPLFVVPVPDWAIISSSLLAATPLVSLLALTPIPLCGIMDNIEPRLSTRRHPLSIIRLAIDPGKAYCILRSIYYSWCPISVIISGAIMVTKGFDILAIVPVFSWCAISLVFLLSALFMTLFYIYRQLFS